MWIAHVDRSGPLFRSNDRHRTFMTGLHARNEGPRLVILPNSMHLPGVFHLCSGRATIDFKPCRDAGALLMAEPTGPIVELAPIIHRSGAKIEQSDAFQETAQRSLIASIHDPYRPVRQDTFQALWSGRVPKPSVEDFPERFGQSRIVHGTDLSGRKTASGEAARSYIGPVNDFETPTVSIY